MPYTVQFGIELNFNAMVICAFDTNKMDQYIWPHNNTITQQQIYSVSSRIMGTQIQTLFFSRSNNNAIWWNNMENDTDNKSKFIKQLLLDRYNA